MIADSKPIAEATKLIQDSIDELSTGQMTFTTLRVITDLKTALESLGAVQTVALPPIDLRPYDDGDVVAYDVVPQKKTVGSPPLEYEVDSAHGTYIIREEI